MDPYEEFEFKPLTDGLGFHKKKIDLLLDTQKPQIAKTMLQDKRFPESPNASKPSAATVDKMQKRLDDIPTFGPQTLTRTPQPEKIFSSTLPRQDMDIPQGPSFKSPRYKSDVPEVAEVFKAPKASLIPNKISSEPLPSLLSEVSFSIVPFLFDLFVVIGLSCLFTGIVLAVTGADIQLVLANAKTDMATRLSLATLLLSVVQLYLILSRSFFGRTLGEWTFDLQIGSEMQQRSAWYPIAVLWRSILVMITGFVLMPVLSLLSRRDLAGRLSSIRRFQAS